MFLPGRMPRLPKSAQEQTQTHQGTAGCACRTQRRSSTLLPTYRSSWRLHTPIPLLSATRHGKRSPGLRAKVLSCPGWSPLFKHSQKVLVSAELQLAAGQVPAASEAAIRPLWASGSF